MFVPINLNKILTFNSVKLFLFFKLWFKWFKLWDWSFYFYLYNYFIVINLFAIIFVFEEQYNLFKKLYDSKWKNQLRKRFWFI